MIIFEDVLMKTGENLPKIESCPPPGQNFAPESYRNIQNDKKITIFSENLLFLAVLTKNYQKWAKK